MASDYPYEEMHHWNKLMLTLSVKGQNDPPNVSMPKLSNEKSEEKYLTSYTKKIVRLK